MVIVVVVVVSVTGWVMGAVWGLDVVVGGGGWFIVRGGGIGRGRGVRGNVKEGEGVWSCVAGCIRVEGGGVVG